MELPDGSSQAPIPGFSDPEEDAHSLVERWALCSDRGLSLKRLRVGDAQASFGMARDHGRESVMGSNIGSSTALPDIRHLMNSCRELPAVVTEPVAEVEMYRRFGARCLVVKNVLSSAMCEYLREFIDRSSQLQTNDFHGLSRQGFLGLRAHQGRVRGPCPADIRTHGSRS